jgi:hypothetical protein
MGRNSFFKENGRLKKTSGHPDPSRVARRYILKPKILIWIHFGGPWSGKGWHILCSFEIHILRPFGTFYGHLVCNLVNFPPFWYNVSGKIWQPWTRVQEQSAKCEQLFFCFFPASFFVAFGGTVVSFFAVPCPRHC